MDPTNRTIWEPIAEFFSGLVSATTLSDAFAVLLILVVGIGIVRLLLNAIKRISRKGLPARSYTILRSILRYGGYSAVFLTAGKRAGLDITAILGAAGIAGIALGFAAQTSVSNVISGLFLFSERAFKIGDVLQIDTITGVVEAVDLMSIRIRTFDNRLVRVPNETLIKSNIVNVTHYPTRRLDIWITLPNGCDYEAAINAVKSAADSAPLALKDPPPVVIIDSISPDGSPMLVGVWVKQDDLISLKNQFIPVALRELEKAGIRPQSRRVEVSSIYPSPGTSLGVPPGESGS